jgi:hypothetical protein
MADRKVRLSIMLVIMVLGLLLAPLEAASAATFTETSADFGGQGLVMPAGLDPANLEVTKVGPMDVADAHVKFMGPVLDIQYIANGQELASPAALTYVYFNMNSTERIAWDRGTADIYYRDHTSGSWFRCGTTFLVEGANPPYGRLACIAPQFTLFGVGLSPTLQSMLPGVEFSEGTVNAFYTENAAQFGDQGVYVPAGLDRNLVAVRMLDPTAAPEMQFKARRLVIQIEWMGGQLPFLLQQGQLSEEQNQAGSTAPSPSVLAVPLNLTYVFYNLDSEERLAWDAGNLSIYYFDKAGNSWTACPTYFVSGSIEDSFGRVACVAPQFTFYAMGISQAEETSSQ